MTCEIRRPGRWIAAAMAAACAALISGCGGSAATRLHALPAPQAPASAERFDASVGVGPVSVPGVLDRLQLVSRDSTGAFVVSDTQRWTEPLGEALARALSEGLARRLGADGVARFPWPRASAPSLQVPVEVLRFEAGPDATVRLEARWSVRDADGGVLQPARHSRVDVPFSGGVEETVRAYGEAAGRLAGDIEAGLRGALAR